MLGTSQVSFLMQKRCNSSANALFCIKPLRWSFQKYFFEQRHMNFDMISFQYSLQVCLARKSREYDNDMPHIDSDTINIFFLKVTNHALNQWWYYSLWVIGILNWTELSILFLLLTIFVLSFYDVDILIFFCIPVPAGGSGESGQMWPRGG